MEQTHQRPPVWTLSYIFIYLPWFMMLEARDPLQSTVVQLRLDHMIPFCEYFIIPYLLWFFYIGAGLTYLMYVLPRRDFYRFVGLFFGGLTICLVLYTFFYTGLSLRPRINPNKNVFTMLIAQLWATDTSTNVCPSIHVFASIVIARGLERTELFQRNLILRTGSNALAVSIILSTMFLKQHSVVDVVCGFVLYGVLYALFYTNVPAVLFQRKPYQRIQA